MNIIQGGGRLIALSLNETIKAFPRHVVIDGPTPLTRLHRLSERCDAMQIKKGSKILCIHSDGLGGLFGYQDELTKVCN